MKRAVFFLILALAIGGALGMSAREEAPEFVHAELAGVKFVYSPASARDDATAAGGLSDRLAFLVSFPGFTAINPGHAAGTPIKLTLTRADEGPDPRERPSKLYARFLTPETQEGPGGLVQRRFEPESPYDSEELLLTPPDGRAFFARCPKAHRRTLDEECLSIFREGAIDVELRYPRTALEHWDLLFEGARGLLARMRGPARAGP